MNFTDEKLTSRDFENGVRKFEPYCLVMHVGKRVHRMNFSKSLYEALKHEGAKYGLSPCEYLVDRADQSMSREIFGG